MDSEHQQIDERGNKEKEICEAEWRNCSHPQPVLHVTDFVHLLLGKGWLNSNIGIELSRDHISYLWSKER